MCDNWRAMKYRISWISKIAPSGGYGGPVFDDYNSAAEYARKMDEQYLDRQHSAMPALELSPTVVFDPAILLQEDEK